MKIKPRNEIPYFKEEHYKTCKYLLNEVCVNADNDDMVADFPSVKYCQQCKYFKKLKKSWYK